MNGLGRNDEDDNDYAAQCANLWCSRPPSWPLTLTLAVDFNNVKTKGYFHLSIPPVGCCLRFLLGAPVSSTVVSLFSPPATYIRHFRLVALRIEYNDVSKHVS